ncbi:hypothetical protein TSOC_006142 [Tetrabaena socialis]|uniref:Uncharacterized protein n=1 Tax=Tetrabaena socialis TaxID=47790 RepID=A0A2J8A4G5_9CHLO|nr:hypothetical protein TSOC_006142 [Tetrabaena socialis]|eukprot:PNH07404.1 hypothetical protein TSOC_006142 [Tetrabaena socialis]
MSLSASGTLPQVLLLTFLAALGCGLRAEAARSVSFYKSAESGVLDLRYDDIPRHLQDQISELGFSVAVADTPNLAVASAFVIPAQNGASFFSTAEDMTAIASYVTAGGLVVMLDAKDGNGEAQRDFIATALGYQGEWNLCKTFGCNSHHSHGQPSVDEHAQAFLPAAVWPAQLEDAQITTVHTWCRHEDASAVSWPLYRVHGDSNKAVAQAFGKVGSPGAVVWLGYSWKDGAQAEWGAMLREVIEQFGNGGYQVPQQGNAAPRQEEAAVDSVIAEVSNIVDDSSDIPPPPAHKRTSPRPPAPAKIDKSPKPSPVPTPSPSKPAKFAKFKGLYGMGMYFNNKTQPAVRPEPHLLEFECGTLTPGSCVQCPRTWAAETSRNVTILFREPWQLDAIHITQLQNPGVLVIDLLPWPAVSIDGLVDKKGKPVPPMPGTLPPPIRNVTVDTSLCSTTLDVILPTGRAGTSLAVAPKGTQGSIPDSLKSTVYGGVNIIVKPQGNRANTNIQAVTFDGRALYPADPNFYTGNDVRVYG